MRLGRPIAQSPFYYRDLFACISRIGILGPTGPVFGCALTCASPSVPPCPYPCLTCPSRSAQPPDPAFRDAGKQFGGGYRLNRDWVRDAPQVRVRRVSDRQKEQLVDLAVVNARLAGKARASPQTAIEDGPLRKGPVGAFPPTRDSEDHPAPCVAETRTPCNLQDAVETRNKAEWLKMRRDNWEQIFDIVTKDDVSVTLETLEECNRKARGVPCRPHLFCCPGVRTQQCSPARCHRVVGLDAG